MSDQSLPADQASSKVSETPSTTSSERPAFRLTRVLLIVMPAVLLFGGVYLFFGRFDGVGWMQDIQKPPLVLVEGQVFYNGEPLPGGQVETQPVGDGLMGARGDIDEQGHFKLQTDVKGTYQPGAYAGEHKVKVTRRGAPVGPAAPPLITPELYADYSTTPFTVQLERPPQENNFTFKLEGEPPGRPSRAEGNGPPARGARPRGNGPPRGNRAQPTAPPPRPESEEASTDSDQDKSPE